MGEWTIGAVLDAIAEAVPDRLMTSAATRRSTFAESADRTRRLANYLCRPRASAHTASGMSCENWECGQDRVALHHAQRPVSGHGHRLSEGARRPGERQLPLHAPRGRRTARLPSPAWRHLPPVLRAPSSPTCCPPQAPTVLISVDDDGSAAAAARVRSPWKMRWRRVIQTRTSRPSPDDVLMICTGGTTGRPKGVHVAAGRHLRRVDERRRPRIGRRDTRHGAARRVSRGSRCRR